MNNEFKLGLLLGTVTAIILSFCFHQWQVTKIKLAVEEHAKEQVEAANKMSKRLMTEAEARDAKHNEEMVSLAGRYERLDSQLNRLRNENARLKQSANAGAPACGTCRVEERDDLLLRMAELGLRTSRAVEEKQAALKNCVGNYGNLTTR